MTEPLPPRSSWLSRRSSPLWELTRTRLLEFVREPAAIFWTFGFPILLALGLGIAFRSKPEEALRIAVEAPAAGVTRAEKLLSGQPGLEVSKLVPAAAAQALRIGTVDLVVSEQPGSDPPTYVLRFDPQRPEGRMARLAVDAALQAASGRRDVARISERRVVEPGSRYIDFLVPGLVGLNLLGSAMWGLGYTVVEARRQKLLKRFAATPMRRSHYLLSFILSRVVFLALEVAALFGFGWAVFGVAVQGSLLDLGLLSLLGGLSFSGLAMLVAARPRSAEVAAGWVNLATMPMWLLSGTFFSYTRFPELVQPLLRLLPLTALNDGLRAITNEGASLLTLGPEMAVLVCWGVVPFFVALRVFRWQ